MERAEPEELETMGVDQVSAPAGDFVDDRLKAAVLYLDRPATAAADDVVVVLLLRLTRDVGVFPGGQIETFERA
jgi:hypothetical protein